MMQYYILKHKRSKRWVAYRMDKKRLKDVHEDYIWRGPYKGLFSAMQGAKENHNEKV